MMIARTAALLPGLRGSPLRPQNPQAGDPGSLPRPHSKQFAQRSPRVGQRSRRLRLEKLSTTCTR
jgi:hypothetical protein